MQKQDLKQTIIKKDFFIKTRKQDIRKYYEFSPKILGRGAYGVVYKTRMIEAPHTHRVVKMIAKKMVKNPQTLQNEINIMRKIDHPLIVRLYETFEDEKNIFLVQDFCQGGQLFSRLEQQGNFSQQDARSVFNQMAKCIKYLHSQKICHRDLKPENFLMNSKKTLELKIIDFGLSCEWKNSMRQELIAAKKNKLIGTSYYIAPEVLKLDYDEKCDIWSLGVILYILVTAAPPFGGDDDKQIMTNVKRMDYSFDIPQAKGLSAQVKDLISRILVPADKRISIDQIFKHPWMNNKLPEIPLKIDFARLKNFANFSKLKALAVSFIATQLPEKDIHHLAKQFEQIDTNNDGFLSVDELKVALQNQKQNTSLADLKMILDHIDTDKNGKINYNEFVSSCLQTSYIHNQQYLEFIFRGMDNDRSGKISKDQIKHVFEMAGVQSLSGKAVQELIDECDKNNDGEIDYKEFLEAMGLKKK